MSRSQLEAAGLRRGAIAHRVSRGRLHRLHRGVYLVGHPVPAPFAHEMAAVLACGETAVLSHRSAARLWELVPPGGDAPEIDVLVAGRKRGSRPGLRIHRAARMEASDIRRRNGIRVTAPLRTLLDLAAVAPPRDLERAFDEAQTRRLVRGEEVLEALDRGPARRGAGDLRAVLRRNAGPTLTRSEAEERLLALVRAARLAPPEVNVRVERHEVDFLWRPARLVVEVDGYAFHSSRRAFERDRSRDAELQAAGLRVLRVTWRQLVHEPEALVAHLARALAGNQGL